MSLRRVVDSEPRPDPAELARQAERLLAELPNMPRGNGFDQARADSMNTYRWTGGNRMCAHNHGKGDAANPSDDHVAATILGPHRGRIARRCGIRNIQW